jgi:hypothetical protein
MEVTAQCNLCKDIITSKLGFTRCKCEAIAVDDGRYLAKDLRNVIEVKE